MTQPPRLLLTKRQLLQVIRELNDIDKQIEEQEQNRLHGQQQPQQRMHFHTFVRDAINELANNRITSNTSNIVSQYDQVASSLLGGRFTDDLHAKYIVLFVMSKLLVVT